MPSPTLSLSLSRSASTMRSPSSPILAAAAAAHRPALQRPSTSLLSKRFASTSSSSSASPRRARYLRNTIYFLCFASIGYTTGTYLTHNYLGGVHAPGSAADSARLSEIRAAFEKLAVVKELRQQAKDAQERGEGEWEEWEPYTNFTEEEKKGRLTSGCLGGSRGVGFQRLFWSASDLTATSIIHLGNALTGWPGIIHGGLQAIILDEALGRAAIRVFPSHTGVTANLNLDYKRPMPQNRFYKVVVQVEREGLTERKARVVGRIEDLEGNVYTSASAVFVVPRRLKLRKLEERF